MLGVVLLRKTRHNYVAARRGRGRLSRPAPARASYCTPSDNTVLITIIHICGLLVLVIATPLHNILRSALEWYINNLRMLGGQSGSAVQC